MSDRQSLILELERSIERGSSLKRAETLRRLTELFTGRAEQLSDEQVELFDEVILRLAREIEVKARAELARRLAPIDNAPPNTIRNLANDEEIDVAAPILMHSRGLQDADLVEIASRKGQAHLLAISARRSLAPSVTDVLVDRGDGDVLYTVAANASASFSADGLAKLVDRASGDDSLVSRIAERPGVPPHLFQRLVLQASGLVQERLLAQASPQMRAEIERVLEKVSHEIDPSVPAPRRFTAARRLIGMLHRSGTLGESELYDLAKSRRYEETVAALSFLCSLQIEQVHWLMNGDRIEPLLIHLKAAGFDWLTVRAIVLLRPSGRRVSAKDLEDICDDYSRLRYATARLVIGQWQGGETALQAAG